MKKIMFVYGTRPEAIKMAPLVIESKKSNLFDVEVCLTGQHRQMLDQINSFFGIKGDYDLNLMKPNQTLFDIVATCLVGLKEVLAKSKPDLIFVQGDTATVLAGALAAYFYKIPVAHLEAGLRSGDKYAPFPQEEAPALGKPVLVMREVTERQEGVEAGSAKLVGTDFKKIVEFTTKLLIDSAFYNDMSNAVNPYGDGTTSRQIVKILHDKWR